MLKNINMDKIGETAYKKAMNAAKEVEPLFELSEKIPDNSVIIQLKKICNFDLHYVEWDAIITKLIREAHWVGDLRIDKQK